MKNSTRISLEKPCNEQFENFLVTSNGGYCGSCSKEVIDFTLMSDQQLIAHFKNTPDKTCGRFKKSQLKTYESNTFTTMKPNLVTGVLGTLSFSLLALCISPTMNAQDLATNSQEVKTELTIQKETKVENGLSFDKYTIKGFVQDEDKAPLPGANVVLKGSSEGTTTDFDGKFEFPRQLEEGDVLVFSYIGFEAQEYTVKASESEIIDITITFDYDSITLLGEVEVVTTSDGAFSSKRNIFKKFIDLFR